MNSIELIQFQFLGAGGRNPCFQTEPIYEQMLYYYFSRILYLFLTSTEAVSYNFLGLICKLYFVFSILWLKVLNNFRLLYSTILGLIQPQLVCEKSLKGSQFTTTLFVYSEGWTASFETIFHLPFT